jgi:hypothetical protein
MTPKKFICKNKKCETPAAMHYAKGLCYFCYRRPWIRNWMRKYRKKKKLEVAKKG